jgi:uncharacterized repeat protein (TIGR02543 family)
MRRYSYFWVITVFGLLLTSSFHSEAQAPLKMRLKTDTGNTITTNVPSIKSYFMAGDGTLTITLQEPLTFGPTDPPISIGPGTNCTIPGDGSVRAQAGGTFSFDLSTDAGAVLSAPVRPYNFAGVQATFTSGVFQWSVGPNDIGTYLAVFQADDGAKSSQVVVMIKVNPGETVTKPTVSGPTTATVGQVVNFTASGSTSSLSHNLEYQFDWKGDGTVLSDWGAATQSHSWANPGTYNVKAKARCITDQVESSWSTGYPVTVSSVPSKYALAVTVKPPGSGTVILSPPGATYAPGTKVTLRAISASSYYFDSWSGDASGTSPGITVTMDRNKSITANFKPGRRAP